jgi:hypothetical protein
LIEAMPSIRASSSIFTATSRVGTSPDSAPSEIAFIAAILAPEKPQPRSASKSALTRSSGAGTAVPGGTPSDGR